MFKFIKTLVEIRDELRLIRKITARTINLSDDELHSLSPNVRLDYSKAEYIPPKHEEELIEEEDDELSKVVDARLSDAERNGRASFYAEDNVHNISESINEE
jgi:fructose-1,6-bisphosphatase